jgi:hypothetical protein
MPVTRRTSTTTTRTSAAAPSAAATTGRSSSRVSEGTRAPRANSTVPVDVKINGFGGKRMASVNVSLVPQPGQAGSAESRSEADHGGWVTRGYIDVRYKPAVGGVDIEIESRQKKPASMTGYKGDEMTLYLQARVLDAGKERIITLATLFDGVMNPDKKSSTTRRFHVDYDDINKYLKKHSPHLQFAPGDPLAAFAVWKTAGHQWGGFMREGYFASPAPIGKRNAIDVRAAGAAGVDAKDAVSVSDVVKPIDITNKVPEAIVKDYPLVLEKGAKLVSRREHETKFCPRNMSELQSVTKKLMAIAASTDKEREAALIAMFGKDTALSKAAGHPISGWKISTTDRYYVKDDAGDVVKDKHGLPLVVPMFDVYQDDPAPVSQNTWGDPLAKFPFAHNNMAVRFRDGEIKAGENVGSMGKLNMKTPRVSDPFSLIQTGLELSLDTKPGITKNTDAMKQLAAYLDKAPGPYNPLIEQKKVEYELKGANALGTAVNNLANRYKFTLEHESGMEIEISMDFVHAGFVFETKEVRATKSMTDTQKFAHYAALLKKPTDDVACVSGPLKEKRGEINTVVFENEKGELVMANFWLDENGKKHATEHPAVRFPQVEMELDHVQARSTGPVQGAYVAPTEVKNIESDDDQKKFLKEVSAKATMNGPPTTHKWEDLKQRNLYVDPNYVALSEAVTKFREHLFPKGVKAARQKAAQALELGGHIAKQKVSLMATMPSASGREVSVETDYQDRTKIHIKSSAPKGTTGNMGNKPATVSIDWDGFPIRIPIKGNATTKQVAETIFAKLDAAVLHKAKLTEKDGEYTIQVSDR